MKRIIIKLTFLLLGFNSFSQCIDCKSLNEALKDPKNVKTVKINAWQDNLTLDSIPSTIELLENLEILYLSDHNIRIIPKEIGKLKKLKELSFAGCKLESLPEEIFILVNLKELILSDNPFSENYKKELKLKLKNSLPNTKVFL